MQLSKCPRYFTTRLMRYCRKKRDEIFILVVSLTLWCFEALEGRHVCLLRQLPTRYRAGPVVPLTSIGRGITRTPLYYLYHLRIPTKHRNYQRTTQVGLRMDINKGARSCLALNPTYIPPIHALRIPLCPQM